MVRNSSDVRRRNDLVNKPRNAHRVRGAQKFHFARCVAATCLLELTLLPGLAAAQPDERMGQAPELGKSPATFDSEVDAEFDSYIRDALVAFDVPGAAVAVVQGNEVVYSGAFGVRGVIDHRSVDTETVFMVGSVTKSMTATMIASLVDESRLQWDTPVVELLPTFELQVPEYTSEVTLGHLLSHQTGVSRYDVPLLVDSNAPLQLVDAVSVMPMFAPPGGVFDYQNQMFSLAGYVAARAAGARYSSRSLARTYEALMQQRLFQPLGMSRTSSSFERAATDPNHAWPNEFDPRAGEIRATGFGFERFATSVAPAGAVWSSIDDMASYALTQVNGGLTPSGRRIVSEQALNQTHTAVVDVGEAGVGYGYGWFVAQQDGRQFVTHSGGTMGFGSDVLLSPSEGWGIVVLTNRASSTYFVQAVERYAVELLEGLEHASDEDLLAAETAYQAELSSLLDLTAPVASADVARYTGRYERGVRFLHRGDALIYRTEFGDAPMLAVAGYPGLFMIVGNTLTGGVAQFTEGEDGEIVATLALVEVEGEEVRFVQPVTLHRQGRRLGKGEHHPRLERRLQRELASRLERLVAKPLRSHRRLPVMPWTLDQDAVSRIPSSPKHSR